MLKVPEKTHSPKILLIKSVRISLLTYPEYSQPNVNRFVLAFATQFGDVAADVLFDSEKETYHYLESFLK